MIGDCVMAFWGHPGDEHDTEFNCCTAALAIRARLGVARDKWGSNGLPQLNCRIGIATGLVLAGNSGSSSHFNYTVLGSPVNLAARLEPLNKALGTRILACSKTHEAVAERVVTRHVASCMIKGFEELQDVYEVLSTTALATPQDLHTASLFDKAMDALADVIGANCSYFLSPRITDSSAWSVDLCDTTAILLDSCESFASTSELIGIHSRPMKSTALALALAGLLAACTAQTECETTNAEKLAKCSSFLVPCQGASSSSSEVYLRKRAVKAAASSGSSDICNCFYEYSRCFKEICPSSSSATIAGKAGISEDECKDKSPDCYYMIWGDPHFVVASAGGKVKSTLSGGRSKAGERHFTCSATAYDNLYASDTMKITATAEPMGGASILVSVTVTLQPSGTVYTTSKSSYGFDTSKTTDGYIIAEGSITVKATNERIVVHSNWGHLTAEIYGYCNTTSTVQTGCDADDDDRNDDVIGHHWRGFRRDAADTEAAIMARAACSAVGDGFVAACEFDVKTTGDSAFAEQAAEATTRLDNAAEFLETYAAVPAATVAGATTATAAIAAGVAGGVACAAAVAGGVGAAVYVVKKRRENSDASETAQAEVSEKPSHGGVNVMNPKPGVHQSITGRAPPVEV
eukprot:m51a1_g6847 putative adenylate guanylate cyclase catalytic domain protein (634) ;mRNA; r:87947-91381